MVVAWTMVVGGLSPFFIQTLPHLGQTLPPPAPPRPAQGLITIIVGVKKPWGYREGEQ